MEAVIASGAQGIRQGTEPGSFDPRTFPRGLSLSYDQEDKLWRQRLFSELEDNDTKRQSSSFLPNDPPARAVKKGEIRVKINVSGMLYETLESTLARFPNTLLGSMQKRMQYFDTNKKEYFFDRNRVAFDAILYYYQSCGRLLRPKSVDTNTFLKEITFFELGEEVLKKFGEVKGKTKDNDVDLPQNPRMRKLWQLMEYPQTSFAAKIVALWSVGVILLSIVIFCLETLPQFKQPLKDKSKAKTSSLHGIEVFCITWFTLEYIIRFIAAPRKLAFIRAPLNIIDILAILPYFITLGITLRDNDSRNTSMVAFFRILRLIRVFRIFKLSRHYRGFKVLGLTLKASTRELLLLSFFLVIGIVLFSSAVYYAESSQFSSIPEAFWWSVVTMTTVGYGDKAPTTDWGRLVGGLCAIAGVLSLALPVPVIVSNFSYFYNQEKELTEPPPPGNVAAPTVCIKKRKTSISSSG